MIIKDWAFSSSRPSVQIRLRRIRNLMTRKIAFPEYRIIKPIVRAARWCVYFVYAPENKIFDSHIYTINKLKSLGSRLLIVYASATNENIPKDLLDSADALYWKALDGFDFSAYTIALHGICENSHGADVFLMNDSVYGPFNDVVEKLEASRWKLTGVTATADVENHLQTYAFHIKGLEKVDLSNLKTVMSQGFCFNHFGAVVLNQETRFSRVASKAMSVGALEYCSGRDLSLASPAERETKELSFLKRSLVEGKYKHLYPQQGLEEILSNKQHVYPNKVVN